MFQITETNSEKPTSPGYNPPNNSFKQGENFTVHSVAKKVVDIGNTVLKQIDLLGQNATKETDTKRKVIDEENISAAGVLYNRLKKIKKQDRKNEFKHKVFDILYLDN